ncbi:MAG: hypothetical protein ACE5K4_04555 [Candidatus Hydrothermarchaeota archaeon]
MRISVFVGDYVFQTARDALSKDYVDSSAICILSEETAKKLNVKGEDRVELNINGKSLVLKVKITERKVDYAFVPLSPWIVDLVTQEQIEKGFISDIQKTTREIEPLP